MDDSRQTRHWWQDWLGAVADPDGRWRLGDMREPVHPGVRGQVRQLLIDSYGSSLTCEFYQSDAAGSSGVVVVVPFYDTPALFGEPTERTRRSGHDPVREAHGLQLAEAGHAVLAVPWWFEQVSAHDPATAQAETLADRYGPAAERHRREQSMSPLGRSIGDLRLAITALQESGLAAGMRIAAFGHSLGAKLTLHLAALDERIEIAAAHEGGLGLAHSNWADPWYLDGAVPEGRDHDELLALVAPRPFLLAGGGDGDGVHNLDLFHRAATGWPEEDGPDLLLHDGGHPLPQHVMAAIREWIRDQAI